MIYPANPTQFMSECSPAPKGCGKRDLFLSLPKSAGIFCKLSKSYNARSYENGTQLETIARNLKVLTFSPADFGEDRKRRLYGCFTIRLVMNTSGMASPSVSFIEYPEFPLVNLDRQSI